MKTKIWVIAPFDSMRKVAEQVIWERSSELNNCDIVISTTNCDITGFETSLDELRKAEEWGAEVIISRGGTASYIEKYTHLPVIAIEVTALDILRAIRKAGQDVSAVCIAGAKNTIYECESLYDFLGVQLRQVTIFHDCDYEGMKNAVKGGNTVLVGDALAVRFATLNGLKGYLIESGKASIYKAIREAESVVKISRREQSRAEMFKTVLDSSTDGIVAIDESAHITFFNKAAANLFQVNQHQVVGCPVSEIILNTRMPDILHTGQSETGQVQMIGMKAIATNRIPIITNGSITGVVATFQEVSQLQKIEQSVRQKLHDKGLTAKFTLDQIIGESKALRKAKDLARTYAPTESTVLITGDSGTGKELFAQSIHNLCSRRNGPFVAVNCAALPEQLLESELFGYEEGAFSGAKRGGKIGLVELAHGGTLFLDEIGEMPLSLQARILRVIQEKEVMRLGGHKVIPVNVRIIVATNQDLALLVANKKFREDLYYRLNVLPLHLPPLKERSDDVSLLVEYFIRKFAAKSTISSISDEAIQVMRDYPWFGNVRELLNVMERLVLLSSGPVIQKKDVEDALSIPNRTLPVDSTPVEMWSLVDELHKHGMGARKIAKAIMQRGYDLKYYQIAYYLNKKRTNS